MYNLMNIKEVESEANLLYEAVFPLLKIGGDDFENIVLLDLAKAKSSVVLSTKLDALTLT